jgi:hypothetical protein
MKKFLVKSGKKVSLKDFDSNYTGKHVDHESAKDKLR